MQKSSQPDHAQIFCNLSVKWLQRAKKFPQGFITSHFNWCKAHFSSCNMWNMFLCTLSIYFMFKAQHCLLFLCLSIVSLFSIHVSTLNYFICLGYWLYLFHLLHLQFWEVKFHFWNTALHFTHFQVSLASQL